MPASFRDFEAKIVQFLGPKHAHLLDSINAVELRWEKDPDPNEKVPTLLLSEPQSDGGPFLAASYTGKGMQKQCVFFRMVHREGRGKKAVLNHVDDVPTEKVIEKAPMWPFEELGKPGIEGGQVAMHHLVLYYLTKHQRIPVHSGSNMKISASALAAGLKGLNCASDGNVTNVKQEGMESPAARRLSLRTSRGNDTEITIKGIGQDIENAGLTQIFSDYQFSPWMPPDETRYRGAQPVKLTVGMHNLPKGEQRFYACIVPERDHERIRFFYEEGGERGEPPRDLSIKCINTNLLNMPFNLTKPSAGELTTLAHWFFLKSGHCTTSVPSGFRDRMQKWLERIRRSREAEEQEDDSLMLVGGGGDDSLLETGILGEASQPPVASSVNVAEDPGASSSYLNIEERELLEIDADEDIQPPVNSSVTATQGPRAADSLPEGVKAVPSIQSGKRPLTETLLADLKSSPGKTLGAGSGARLMPVANMIPARTHTLDQASAASEAPGKAASRTPSKIPSRSVASSAAGVSTRPVTNTQASVKIPVKQTNKVDEAPSLNNSSAGNRGISDTPAKAQTTGPSERNRVFQTPNGRCLLDANDLEQPGTVSAGTLPTEGPRGTKRSALRASLEQLHPKCRRYTDHYEQMQRDLDEMKQTMEVMQKLAEEASKAADEQDELAEKLDQAKASIRESATQAKEAIDRRNDLNKQIQKLIAQRDEEARALERHKLAKDKAVREHDEIQKQKEPVDLRVDNLNAKLGALNQKMGDSTA